MEMAIWVTKLGEYDQLNHTAEFVLNGEANESIVVRIDYHDHGQKYTITGGAASQPNDSRRGDWRRVLGMLASFSPEKQRVSSQGVGTSLMLIAGFAVLAFVLFVIEMLSYMG